MEGRKDIIICLQHALQYKSVIVFSSSIDTHASGEEAKISFDSDHSF